jgi:hypothetical protein
MGQTLRPSPHRLRKLDGGRTTPGPQTGHLFLRHPHLAMEPSSLAENISPPPLTPPPNPQARVEEFVRRISDPQDLEDGLLATAHAAMLGEVQKQALAAEERAPSATPSGRAVRCSATSISWPLRIEGGDLSFNPALDERIRLPPASGFHPAYPRWR